MCVIMAAIRNSESENEGGGYDGLADAFQRIEKERTAHSRKQSAYCQFKTEIKALESGRNPPDKLRSNLPTIRASPGESGPAEQVIHSFVQEIGPCVEDEISDEERLVQLLTEELSEGVTEALLSSAAAGCFPEQMKHGLLTVVEKRISQQEAVVNALALERESLRRVEREVKDVALTLEQLNDQSLLHLGFSELEHLHDEVDRLLDCLDEIAAERQEDIFRKSGTKATKVDHHSVVEMCYRPLEQRYPGLSEIAAAADTCNAARSTVESHLIRRV